MGVKVSQTEKLYPLKDKNLQLESNAINNKNNSAIQGLNCSVFKKPDLLINIRKSDELLRAYTNGVHQDSYMKGYHKEFFEVWFNIHFMRNILFLS